MKWLLTTGRGSSPPVNYLSWCAGAGIETAVVRPGEERPGYGDADALLLTGGGDVAPDRYRCTTHAETCEVDPDRDALELALVAEFVGLGRPVLGICRGLQVIQVAGGGALHQHVPALPGVQGERHAKHGGKDSEHGLVWLPGTAMADTLGPEAERCNSSHHQAADPGTLPPHLRIAALSPAGIVEAIESVPGSSPFISCVQWHPERMDPRLPAAGGLLAYWVARTA